MLKFYKMINKRASIIIFLIIILTAVFIIYLNRSYAHFYSYMGDKALINPNIGNEYRIENSEASTTLVYVALGDSLTSGVGCEDYRLSFPYQLAEKLSKNKKQNVLLENLSIPGSKSADILDQIKSISPNIHPDTVTLFVGINDMHNFVSFKEFENNLNESISYLKQNIKAEIIMVNIPLLGSPKLLWWPYDWYFAVKSLQYNKIINKVCNQQNLKCFNINDVKSDTQSFENFYSTDLFHPSCTGYTSWSNNFYANFSK